MPVPREPGGECAVGDDSRARDGPRRRSGGRRRRSSPASDLETQSHDGYAAAFATPVRRRPRTVTQLDPGTIALHALDCSTRMFVVSLCLTDEDLRALGFLPN